MEKTGKIKFFFGILVIIALLAGGACWYLKTQSARARWESKILTEAPLVKTQTVNSGEASETFNYSGEIRGHYESQIAFQVSGKIIRRNVELGSVVKKGAVLFQIDPVDIGQGVAADKAQVMAAESQYKLAKDNLNRFKEVYNQKYMSKAELDRYQTMSDAAEAQLRQAKAQYNARANQYNYCNLIANSSGVVAGIYAETGQVVAAGQPVVVIVSGGEREVEINVPESRWSDFNQQQAFKVTFWALPDVTVEGKMREIAPMADMVTRTYKARITLINPPSSLKLGMTATVTTTGKTSDAGASAAYIPLAAIYQTDDIPNVWVVSQGVVKLKPVKLGDFGVGDQVQVLEGIHGGDVIVTAGVHKLREGEKVRTGGDNE